MAIASCPTRNFWESPSGRHHQAGCVVIGYVHAHHRQIGCGIVADGAGGEAAAVGEGNLNACGLVHHVAVGENQAVGSEHETGAAALPLARLAGTVSSPPARHRS